MPNDDAPMRALLMTPSGDRARLVEHALAALPGWDWARVTSRNEVAALVSLKEFQVLIADAEAPTWGSDSADYFKLKARSMPIVALGREPRGPQGIEDAWMDWDRFSRARLAAVLGAVVGWRGVAEPGERAYDPETGLPGGRLFLDQARQAYGLARRQRSPLGALLLRLDEPGRSGAPALGHPSGRWRREGVLAVRRALRDSDLLGLLADAELAVLLPALSRPEEVVAVGQRLLEDLRRQMGPQGAPVVVSLGAALLPMAGGDAETLFNAARKGAARSLALGGDCIHFDDPELDLAAADRFRYEVDMRCGLLAGQFTLHFQPQASLDGAVRGAEALLRWLHPQRGPVPPSEFIPFSESCGFIEPLSAWALRRALRAVKDLAVMLPELKMSVNLSPRQFRDPGLVDAILGALREEGCPGSRLCVEVTETSALIDVEQAARTLQSLRDAGIKVALDDFGSGYASVGYLKQLPLDYVKLDRSLVQELGRRKDDERIAELVVSIAPQQGLTVIAEGVEDESQLEALRRVGCDQYQGYFLAQPQPLEQLENWLKAHRAKNTEASSRVIVS